jgi:mRNA interferase RelE/StbE/toxin YoeB
VSPEPDPRCEIVVPNEFRENLRKLTKKDKALADAYGKEIAAVAQNPQRVGKRSVEPKDTRHVHVKRHWVLWWRVDGNRVILLDCGHHDEFF